MHILIEDGFAVERGTGIGQYTLNVLHQLCELPGIESVRLVEKPFLAKISRVKVRRFLYIAWLNSGFQFLLHREHPHIVHFTNYLLPAIKLTNSIYVVTVHDLAAWKFPLTFPPSYIPYIKNTTYFALMRADLILTVSERIKEEIIEIFGINPNKIFVIYNTVNKIYWTKPKKTDKENDLIKRKLGIKKDFILFVGSIEKRKNLLTLIKAFALVRNYINDMQLVLSGPFSNEIDVIIKYIKDNPELEDSIILSGYLNDEDLVNLYDMAIVFVFPSLYEGFGRPLVEAMVRGVPIVASKIPSTLEIAGEAAFYYNAPHDHEDLAEKILRVVGDNKLRRELVEKGLARAKEFSWERIGNRYLQAYGKVLSK